MPLATFAYDALGRKITAWTQYDVQGGTPYDVQGGTQGDSNTSDLRLHHDGQVEIADYHGDGSLARRFVNGTQYIDERAVLIEGEAGGCHALAVIRVSMYPRCRSMPRRFII
ncbi:MAG: hypothetical protein IT449_10865 [Phycisphaerales bacterium]|nr:hypothetical protein [Phycisphaerales bacterium]